MIAKTTKLVNSAPLNVSEKDLTKGQLNALKHEWRLKLKEDGFDDIEKWSNSDSPTSRIIKGHIRRSDYLEKDFLTCAQETLSYFRIIETYVFYSDEVPDKYKNVLIDYCMTGNLTKSCSIVFPKVKRPAIYAYIQTNFDKMKEFSERFHSQPDDIELGESNEIH